LHRDRHQTRLRGALLGTSALVAAALVFAPAHAQQFFNGSQTTPNGAINGGNGVWDTTTTNWTNAIGSVSNLYDPTTATVTVFGASGSSTPATGGTVTVDAGGIQLTGTVQFRATGNNSIYTIAGGGLILAPGGTTFDVANVSGGSGASAVISSVIADNNDGLIKTGAGTLTLSGANTYTGGTTISGGTVAAASQTAGVIDALGSGTVNLDGGKLRATVSGDLQNAVTFADNKTSVLSAATGQQVNVVSSPVLGPGSTAQFGATGDTGTVVLSGGGSADATSKVVVAGGTLKDGGNASITSLTFFAASTTVNAGAVLDFNDSFNQAIRNLKGAGSVVTGSVGGTMLTLFVDDATTSTFSGVISGPGAVMVQSTTGVTPGTMILSGDNTYTGGTTICFCTVLQLGDGGTTGSIVGNVANGGTLIFNRSNTFDFTGDISDDGPDAGKVVQAGAGITILSGNNSYSGGTTITAGTLRVMNNNSVGSGTVTLDGGTFQAGADGLNFTNPFAINTVGGTFDTNGKTLTISGDIADGNGPGGALTKIGAGTLALAGNNSYTGATNILAGTLRVDSSSALPMTTDVKVNNGAMLDLTDGVSVDINSLADGPGGGGTVKIGTADITTTLFIGFNGGATTTFSGAITGAGSLELDGGLLTLTGASSIGGDLTICSCATLTITGPGASFTAAGDPGAFTNGTNVLGTLNVLNGATFATNNLLVGGTMTVDGTGTTATIAGLTLVGAASSAANLTISGGAVVNSQGGAVIENPFQAATARVTGQGSSWNVGGGLAVGGAFAGAPGYLTVAAGGAVNVTGSTLIGSQLGSFGPVSTMTVTGPTSSFKTGSLDVGSACGCGGLAGVLNIVDGGTVTATGLANIAPLGLLSLGVGALGGTINAPVITNDGMIVAWFTDTITLASNIAGSGSLTKVGPGTLIMTGISTYTGQTYVAGGTLVMNGSITSPVMVTTGATLAGSGTVGSTTINNGATLSPGNSIGTITVNGNITFYGAGNYRVEVSPAAADRTNVAGAPGTAAIDGTLTAVGTGGTYKVGTRYTVLSTTGGLSGAFTSFAVSGNFGATRPHLEYDANNVYLVLDPNAISPSLTAGTRNQRAVAAGVDSAIKAGNTGGPFAALFGLTANQLPPALDALSGEVHASTAGVLVDESLYARAAILGRLRQASYGGETSMASLSAGGPHLAFAHAGALAYGKSPIVTKAPMVAPAPTSDIVFWSQGFGAWGRFNGDGNAANVRRDLAGFFTGLDSRAGANGRVGIAAGCTGSKNALDGRGTATVDTGHVAAYAGWSFGALNLRGGGAFAFHTIDTDRTIAFPGFFDRTAAHYQGRTGQVFGELGYGFTLANVAIEPFAGAAWVHLNTDAAAERGGLAALNFAGTRFEVGYSTLGVRAASMIALADGMMLVPRVTAAWQHAYGNVVPQAALAFQGVGTPFTIAGVPIARDALLTEAGLDLAIGAHATIGVSYTGQYAGNVQDHAAKGRFSWKF
jgi:outer membrane autotransporter protein